MITKRKPKVEALLQIIILVVGIIAISYAIGSSIEVVSAGDPIPSCPNFLQKSCEDNSDCGQCCDGTYLKNSGTCTFFSGDGKYYCSYSSLIGTQVEGKCGYTKPTTTEDDEQTLGEDIKEGIKTTGNIVSGYNTIKQVAETANKGLETTKSSATVPSNGGGNFGLGETLANFEGGQIKTEDLNFIGELPGTSENLGISEDIITEKNFWKKIGETLSSSWLVKNSIQAAIIYFGLKKIASMVGDEKVAAKLDKIANHAALAFISAQLAKKFAGDFVKKALMTIFKEHFVTSVLIPGLGWIVAGATIVIELLLWKNEKVQVVEYTCQVWEPEKGGQYCEECNKGIFPCTEYRCKSLGAACELINVGEKEQMCVSTKDDGRYPTITAWEDALLSSDYKYAPAGVVAPPDKGVYVQYTKSNDGCVPAFTPLSFGITLNEAAYCKYSVARQDSYAEMEDYLSGGLALYNHSVEFSLPSTSSLEAEGLILENGGDFDLYIRCEDSHGHSNNANFVFKFCVDEGPDYTNPNIESASPLNGAPIAHNEESTDVTFYVNEPAECKWSHTDKDYENMENSMSCATSVLEMNAYMLYPCTTTLTGLENNKENKFYVRCKDKSENTNTESYEYTLIGTDELILDFVTPNNTIVEGPTTSVKVEIEARTSAGYEDGISTCYYSETGESGTYVQFYETNSFEHFQDLWLSEGEYEYFIKCVDLGGNTDTSTITFEVETDTESPVISRVYNEDGFLKIITDESADCVYDNVNCNYVFDEGISMISTDGLEHFVSWNSNVNFYIKCKDENGIHPPQNECTLIVRPFDAYSE